MSTITETEVDREALLRTVKEMEASYIRWLVGRPMPTLRDRIVPGWEQVRMDAIPDLAKGLLNIRALRRALEDVNVAW